MMEDDRKRDSRVVPTDTANPDGPMGIPLDSKVGKMTHGSGMSSISYLNSLDRFALPISPMTDTGTVGHHPQGLHTSVSTSCASSAHVIR